MSEHAEPAKPAQKDTGPIADSNSVAKKDAQAVENSVERFGVAALSLDPGAIRQAGAMVAANWLAFSTVATSARVLETVKHEDVAALDALTAMVRKELARVGPLAVHGTDSFLRAVPADPTAFLHEQIDRTATLATQAQAVVKSGGQGYAELALHTERREELQFIQTALTQQGLPVAKLEGEQAGDISAHRDDLYQDYAMRTQSKTDLSPTQASIIKGKATVIQVSRNQLVAKETLSSVSGPERDALVAALRPNGGLNWILENADPELVALIQGTKAGAGETFDDRLKPEKDKGITDALTDPEFYKTAGKMIPGRLTNAASSFVRSAGSVPIIGKAIGKVTDPIAGLLDRATVGLDDATGTSEVWKRSPDAKNVSDTLSGASGELLFGAATAGVGTATAAARHAETAVEAVEFLESLEHLAQAYESAKTKVDLFIVAVKYLPAALIKAATGDRDGALEEVDKALDGALDLLGEAAGEEATQALLPEHDRKVKEKERQEKFEKQDHLDAAKEQAIVSDGPAPTKTEEHAEAAPGAGPVAKVDPSKWGGLGAAVIKEVVKALIQALNAMKTFLIAQLKSEKGDARNEAAKQLAHGAAGILKNVLGDVADPVAGAVATALDTHFIRPFLLKEKLGVVPASVYVPQVKNFLKTGAVTLFDMVTRRFETFIQGELGVVPEPPRPEKKEDAKE